MQRDKQNLQYMLAIAEKLPRTGAVRRLIMAKRRDVQTESKRRIAARSRRAAGEAAATDALFKRLGGKAPAHPVPLPPPLPEATGVLRQRQAIERFTPVPQQLPIRRFVFPPYFDHWVSTVNPGDNQENVADADAGTCTVSLFVDDGASESQAAIVVAFRTVLRQSSARIAPLVEYVYNWLDSSFNGYTAHNDGWIRLELESTALDGSDRRAEMDPRTIWLWSDGTGWNESHGSSGDGANADVGGRLSAGDSEIILQATNQRLYLLTVTADVSADGSSGVWGGSFANATISARIPWVVVEENT